MDPRMFYGIGTIALIYVYDVLCFSPDQDMINEVIKKVKYDGLYLTVE